jgi:hypothetical protein
MVKSRRKPRVGDWVQVRSKEDILQTLDQQGRLDEMPFMPEMFEFCGQSFQIYKRAHKTCDTVFPIRGRRVHGTVHLATRCNGQAHGGCQAGCLIFWKEAWLKPLDGNSSDHEERRIEALPKVPAGAVGECKETDVWAHAQSTDDSGGVPVFACQATRLPYATTNLAWWDIRQYLEDYTSGNVSLRRILNGFVYSMYHKLAQAGIGLGRPLRLLYDWLHPLWRGTPYPRKGGTILAGQPTPTQALNLQPGELVRVKSHEEILQTLSTANQNRGMYWDAEMVPYCGQTHRVLKRVTRIVDEKTGKIQEMKSPCIILESVVCQSRYSECRMFCPRSIYPYWREIWLERDSSAISSNGKSRSG